MLVLRYKNHDRHLGDRWILSGVLMLVLAAVPGFASTSTTSQRSSSAKLSSVKTTGKSKKSAASKSSAKHGSKHSTSHAIKHSKHAKATAKHHGQQQIDSERAKEIQAALIREHYMEGEPTGVWDATSQAAMQRYQAENGWQNKSVPDSRALIKLGLGPDHGGLLNPDSAMTAPPELHPQLGAGTIKTDVTTDSATGSQPQ